MLEIKLTCVGSSCIELQLKFKYFNSGKQKISCIERINNISLPLAKSEEAHSTLFEMSKDVSLLFETSNETNFFKCLRALKSSRSKP